MHKKLFFSAILLMALALPHSLFAHDFSAVAPTGQTLYYNINSDGVCVTHPGHGYDGDHPRPTGALTIPSTVTYGDTTYSVTTIGFKAFEYCTGLTSVNIPSSVTSIGKNAFLRVKHIEYHGRATGSPWGAKTMNEMKNPKD